MARKKRGLGALEAWITVGIICQGFLTLSNAQETTTKAPSCDDVPSPELVDSTAWLVMSRTTERGQTVQVNRTFAFYICRAPGFVFNFQPEFPLYNQFALWCEDRRPGVWLPTEQVPRCQPESVKAATPTTAKLEDSVYDEIAIMTLFQMITRATVPFLDIDKMNMTFRSAGDTTARNAFSMVEDRFGTSNPDNLDPAIKSVKTMIFSRKEPYAYKDILEAAAAAQLANDPNLAANTGRLYGQTDDSKAKKVTGTIGALIGAGVFVAVFMVCTIMSRIRDFR